MVPPIFSTELWDEKINREYISNSYFYRYGGRYRYQPVGLEILINSIRRFLSRFSRAYKAFIDEDNY